jgi:hypothetical protein
MKILWVSKYHPLTSQVKELKRLYGEDVEIDIFDKLEPSLPQIVKMYRAGKYDEMVVISSLSLVHKIVGYGFKPLYVEMGPAKQKDYELKLVKRRSPTDIKYYKFVKFKRLEKIDMVFSDL